MHIAKYIFINLFTVFFDFSLTFFHFLSLFSDNFEIPRLTDIFQMHSSRNWKHFYSNFCVWLYHLYISNVRRKRFSELWSTNH